MTAADAVIFIGKYRIEPGYLFHDYAVRKALGPWPLQNWSWVTFFDGTMAECRDYIEWATRLDKGDAQLTNHVNNWLAGRTFAKVVRDTDEALHLPKCWGYNVGTALLACPRKPSPTTNSSTELLCMLIIAIGALICGFIYHSM